MSELQVSSSGGDALQRVGAALDELQGSLPRDVFNAVEQETLKLMDLARAKVQAMPTHGNRHTGLLQTVAEGVGLTSVVLGDSQSLRVTTSVPRSNMTSIPAGLDDGSWSHPLFGNRDHWYTQHGAYSWFTETFQDGRQQIEDSVRSVLEKARDRLAASAAS